MQDVARSDTLLWSELLVASFPDLDLQSDPFQMHHVVDETFPEVVMALRSLAPQIEEMPPQLTSRAALLSPLLIELRHTGVSRPLSNLTLNECSDMKSEALCCALLASFLFPCMDMKVDTCRTAVMPAPYAAKSRSGKPFTSQSPQCFSSH
ncbi:hypothetical protein NQZ68_010644 [Dissostichus eleginoides]|nr:hypothetical protein NQZ68_010644 [Dissostichus eleginoides]